MNVPEVRDDLLVNLDPDRLTEARQTTGLSIRALAMKAGLRQQTVDAMLRTKPLVKPRRCRRSNRNALAKALGLPDATGSLWLGGEIPFLINDVRRAPSGYRYIGMTKSPSNVQLARYRLLERCFQACARDSESRPPKTTTGREGGENFFAVKEAIHRLTEVFWWRGQLLQPEEPAYELEGEFSEAFLESLKEAETRPVLGDFGAHEKIEMALITTLDAILTPWFEGEAELNYENLLTLGNREWWEPVPSLTTGKEEET